MLSFRERLETIRRIAGEMHRDDGDPACYLIRELVDALLEELAREQRREEGPPPAPDVTRPAQ